MGFGKSPPHVVMPPLSACSNGRVEPPHDIHSPPSAYRRIMMTTASTCRALIEATGLKLERVPTCKTSAVWRWPSNAFTSLLQVSGIITLHLSILLDCNEHSPHTPHTFRQSVRSQGANALVRLRETAFHDQPRRSVGRGVLRRVTTHIAMAEPGAPPPAAPPAEPVAPPPGGAAATFEGESSE
eukprot:COSAG06_NODE_9032_length_2007_cov_30.719602_2_plen_184_part_00